MKKAEQSQIFHCLRQTRFGPVAVVWRNTVGGRRSGVCSFPAPDFRLNRWLKNLFPDSGLSSCTEIDTVAERISAFLAGEAIRFPLAVARLDLCSPFRQQVLRAEHGIPRGRVSTYQRIATHLGNPRAARAVGTALAHNPFPIIIPCHRAIRSDGTLGGFQGGMEMKRALLEMEGIEMDNSGRVDFGRLGY